MPSLERTLSASYSSFPTLSIFTSRGNSPAERCEGSGEGFVGRQTVCAKQRPLCTTPASLGTCKNCFKRRFTRDQNLF